MLCRLFAVIPSPVSITSICRNGGYCPTRLRSQSRRDALSMRACSGWRRSVEAMNADNAEVCSAAAEPLSGQIKDRPMTMQVQTSRDDQDPRWCLLRDIGGEVVNGPLLRRRIATISRALQSLVLDPASPDGQRWSAIRWLH